MNKVRKPVRLLLALALILSSIVGASATVLANNLDDYSVTCYMVPPCTGDIIWEGHHYFCSQGPEVGAGEYDIEANLGSGYIFSEWQVEGLISVDDSNSPTTTCRVDGDGILTMVQTACPPWVSGDPHKMHDPPPEPDMNTGKDVGMWWHYNLADDFQCSESGWITDVHIWVSWYDDSSNDDPTPRSKFRLAIWEDFPADPQDPDSYSMPGTQRWYREFEPGEYIVGPRVDTQEEDFIHPNPEGEGGEVVGTDNYIYQYTFCIDPGEIYQEEDEILWLSAVQSFGQNPGWKTSLIHFNDYAVIQETFGGPWKELIDASSGDPMELDFAFIITGYGADLGDAPDPTYPTLLINDGARHVSSGVHLGAAIDIDPDGQQHANALGDDINGDDEDGVNFTSPIWPGGTASVDVFLTSPTGDAKYLNAWLDFNIDGSWAGEQIFTDQLLTPGNNSLTFDVPTDASAGSTFARFRVDSTGGLSYTGMADDGEVEDYWVNIVEVDFGDAPDPTYPTLLASNGARHIVTEMFLGNRVDHDADGQPTTTADGDDTADLNDDEDGVTFTSPILPGSTASVDVFLTSPLGSGYLNAWMDFDIDGSWAGEQIFTNQVLSPGLNSLTFSVPSEALLGTTFTRFRVDPQGFLGDDEEVYGGEVEDYQVEIEELPPPPPPAVGGDVYPANKVALFAPWIALAMLIVAGGFYLVRRRVHN